MVPEILLRLGYRGEGQQVIDRVLALLARTIIWLYQRLLSRWTGRTCHFRPTCSAFAAASFRALGFRDGLAATRARLGDCCGTYSLRLGSDARVEMLARSGSVYTEEELAPHIVAKLSAAQSLAYSNVGVSDALGRPASPEGPRRGTIRSAAAGTTR